MTARELIERHEGRRKVPYTDSLGFRTIGCGWNLDARPLPSGKISIYLQEHGQITDEMIDQLLDISIKVATSDCEELFPKFDEFTENRQMALVDFLFNLGIKRAKGFKKAIAAINTGRWEDAGKEMEDSTWAKQVKGRAAEVTELIEEG